MQLQKQTDEFLFILAVVGIFKTAHLDKKHSEHYSECFGPAIRNREMVLRIYTKSLKATAAAAADKAILISDNDVIMPRKLTSQL